MTVFPLYPMIILVSFSGFGKNALYGTERPSECGCQGGGVIDRQIFFAQW